jgi:hypothetical protein
VGAIQVVVIIAGVLLTSAMLKLYGDGEDLLPLAHYNQAPIWLRHYGFVLPLK